MCIRDRKSTAFVQPFKFLLKLTLSISIFPIMILPSFVWSTSKIRQTDLGAAVRSSSAKASLISANVFSSAAFLPYPRYRTASFIRLSIYFP